MWDRFIDSVDRRITRGWRIIGKAPWEQFAIGTVVLLASPVLIPIAIVNWTVGYVSERRENKRNGVLNVR